MSKAKQLAYLILAVFLVLVTWYLLSVYEAKDPALDTGNDSAASQETDKQPVIVQSVSFESDASRIVSVGTGQAQQSITLTPESAGQVRDVLFKSGDSVREGDLLLTLDKEDEELALELAKLQLQDTRQRLARYEQAAPSRAVSATEVDQARNALSVAQIELSQAELAYTKRMILAPFDGVIGRSQVDAGERVTESSVIATLDDASNLNVDFNIPESFAYAVQEGQQVVAQTWALPGEEFTGKIRSIENRIDRETRTLQVRAQLPNKQGRLRTGMSFVIELFLSGELYPAVPAVAVQWDREAAYVWLVHDGVAERQTVEVLKRANGWALLSGQLSREDQVVIEGIQSLRGGMSVDVRSQEAAPEELSERSAAGTLNDG